MGHGQEQGLEQGLERGSEQGSEYGSKHGLERALARTPSGDRPRFGNSRLVGGRCEDCAAVVWPARAVCHRCGGCDVGDVALAPTATLLSCTDVHVERPGLPVPYTLGQVRVDGGGPLLFGLVRGLVEPVRLPCAVGIVVPGEHSAGPPYWFQAQD